MPYTTKFSLILSIYIVLHIFEVLYKCYLDEVYYLKAEYKSKVNGDQMNGTMTVKCNVITTERDEVLYKSASYA